MQSILLIEDSKFLSLANARTLSKAGYHVLTAADGEEALRIAHGSPLGVILLDMMLPKMSGPEVLQHLKKNPVTANVPVIVLTALSKKNEEKLRQAGAFSFLEKECILDNPALLLDTIALALKKNNEEGLKRFVDNATLPSSNEAHRDCGVH